jgi:hypothetical protein
MNLSQALALHEDLLDRAQSAQLGLDEIMGLMREFQALTRRINDEPDLSGNIRLHALNAMVLAALMEKASRAFVAACQAMRA